MLIVATSVARSNGIGRCGAGIVVGYAAKQSCYSKSSVGLENPKQNKNTAAVSRRSMIQFLPLPLVLLRRRPLVGRLAI